METQQFQKKCSDMVDRIDKKYNIDRDPHLSFTQLMEEIGELAKDINLPKLRNKEIDVDNLEGEFADVFMQLCALAELYHVDIEESTERKMEILKGRHNL